MGTQKPVIMGGEPEEIISGPIAEHHGKKKEKKKKVEEKIKAKKFPKEKAEVSEEGKTSEAKSADLPVEASAKAEEKEAAKKKVKVGKAKVRSKKYQKAKSLIDSAKKYEIGEAIELVKKTSITNFDGNVEVHLRLVGKSGKPEQLRGLLNYPHPTGKKISVGILNDEVIGEIEKTGKAPADIYLATPTMMPKIAKLAKILGPKGKMPNPKAGTITENPEKTKKELEAGQVEYKTDSSGNIHQVIGKVSADKKNLEENFQALLAALPSEKIVSITLCATMGPGIKVQI
jgi:large subunit ribosomal protein L1